MDDAPVIHLVDDDESFQTAVSRLLRAAGYAVRTYSNADDFLLSRSDSAPGCILLDIRMPGRNGIEATRILAADAAEPLAVLVVTTFDLDDYVFGALEAGAAGFLLKGSDEQTLITAIRSVAAGEGTLDQKLTLNE